MLQFIAILIGSLAGYLPHLLFGEHLSFMGEFLWGSLVGGLVYVLAIYALKKARGDF
jgi:hypothetical protein